MWKLHNSVPKAATWIVMSTMRQYFGGSNAGSSKTMRELGVNDCNFFPTSCERGPFRKGMPQERPFTEQICTLLETNMALENGWLK